MLCVVHTLCLGTCDGHVESRVGCWLPFSSFFHFIVLKQGLPLTGSTLFWLGSPWHLPALPSPPRAYTALSGLWADVGRMNSGFHSCALAYLSHHGNLGDAQDVFVPWKRCIFLNDCGWVRTYYLSLQKINTSLKSGSFTEPASGTAEGMSPRWRHPVLCPTCLHIKYHAKRICSEISN